jgi:ABC-2 type transport system permease protein
MKFFEQIKKSFAIAKKDLAIYYLRGPVLIQGLLIPAFLFIAFSFKRDMAFEFLIPGLWGMALFFAVSAITPVIAPWETKMKTFERLASSPITLWAIILGDVIASVIFGLIITFFVFLASTILIGISIMNIQLVIGSIIAAFCFSALGTLISAPPADNPSNIMLFATLIKFPLIFISGIFVPITEMGNFKMLSYISPLTYFTDLARYSVQGTSYFTPIFDIMALIVFTAVFFMISVVWHKKSLSKRF